MSSLKCLVWNVRGLRDKSKRNAVMTYLKAQHAQVMVLVETHLTGQLMLSLKKPWLGWVYQAPYSAYSRGVAILVAKTTQFVMLTLRSDPQGKFLFIHCRLNGLEVLILAIYIPPPFQFHVINEGLDFMAQFPTIPALWMGDFNAVLDNHLDRTSLTSPIDNTPSPTRFGKLLGEMGLIDAWRSRHPLTKEFTCFSATHNTMSRIDLILISNTLAPNLKKAGMSPRILSDHTPCWIELEAGSPSSSFTWRLNPFWLSAVPGLEVMGEEWEFFFRVNTGTAPLDIVWDMFKTHARMLLAQKITRHKHTSNDVIRQAELAMADVDKAFSDHPSTETANRVKLQMRIVNGLHFERAERKIFYIKQKVYECGERAGRLLAYLAHMEHKPPTVVALRDHTGDLIQDPDGVVDVFRAFYASLYSSKTDKSKQEITDFLSNIAFTQLTSSQIEILEAPISKDDVAEAMSHLASSKAPGSDGLPLEFYNTYSEILTPKLHELFNYMFDSGSLPKSMNEAFIVLILKPGKDPTLPESYRPISLLQLDIKILAKVLALRMNKVILSLIHPDQTGFMPTKNTAFNLRRLYMNLQARHDQMGTRVVVSLDAAKAFNSVEWEYLWGCLARFGFGPKFTRWIQLLYQAPSARILINGKASQTFPLTRGTRQGCPLSPLLYALAVEPLATALREHPRVRGLSRGPLVEKISLYADDMLLYLEDSGDSLLTALDIIKQFGTYSGLKINWEKSQILPVDLGVPTETQVSSPLMRVSEITYLGIKITRTPVDYIRLNLEPLFQILKSKIQLWSRLPLGIMGRVNLTKMILLPKFLYVFWHAPVYIPLRFFKTIEVILNTFVWGKARHKLSWQVLKNPTDLGGTALPDYNLYYLAAQLSHFFHIDKSDKERFMLLIGSQTAKMHIHPFQLILRENRDRNGTEGCGDRGLLYTYCKIWEIVGRKLKIPSTHRHHCGTTQAYLNYYTYLITSCGSLEGLFFWQTYTPGQY